MSELETQARDRSDNQAAVAQIEVTPEMIEAGANRVFELWGEVSTAYLVREVFQAMMRERRYSVALPKTHPEIKLTPKYFELMDFVGNASDVCELKIEFVDYPRIAS
jgi:hypothetical protein